MTHDPSTVFSWSRQDDVLPIRSSTGQSALGGLVQEGTTISQDSLFVCVIDCT